MPLTDDTSLTNTYDCTPHPVLEKVTHHVARVVHNVFHPHHKQFYIAPMALVCHAPEMETITISTDAPLVSIPTDKNGVPQGGGDYGGYGDYGYSGYYGGYDSYDGCYSCGGTTGTPPLKTVSVPEPGPFLLMMTGFIAVLIIQKMRGRIKSH